MESAFNVSIKGAIAPSHAGNPAFSCTPTLTPAPIPTLISIEKLFTQFIKTYKASVKVL